MQTKLRTKLKYLTKNYFLSGGHVCRDCNQNFPGKVPLDRHKYEVHGKRIDTHCEQCDKFFMDTTNAKKHMKLMHPIQVQHFLISQFK